MKNSRYVFLCIINAGSTTINHDQYNRFAQLAHDLQQFFLSARQVEASTRPFFTYRYFAASQYHNYHFSLFCCCNCFLHHLLFFRRYIKRKNFTLRKIWVYNLTSFFINDLSFRQSFLYTFINSLNGSISRSVTADKLFLLICVRTDHHYRFQCFLKRQQVILIL